MKSDLEKFRVVDLTLLSILAMITEIMGAVLHLKLPGAGFYLSFSILITIIGMFRWNVYGVIIYIMSAIPMLYLGENNFLRNVVMYLVANSFIIVVGWGLQKVNKRDILEDPLKLLSLIIITYAVVSAGKGFGLLVLGEPFFYGSIMYFVAQLFNIIIAFLALLFLKRREGLLVDMKDYFERYNLEERL